MFKDFIDDLLPFLSGFLTGASLALVVYLYVCWRLSVL